MHRPRKLRMLLAATSAAAVIATVAPASATAAADAEPRPSKAYELFRQAERDFVNRHG